MLKDYFGKNADILKKKKLWLFDMDGTIYNENTLFPGTLSLLNKIEQNGGRYIFITNNSSKSVKDYVKKVNSLGIKADINNFFTSTQATILLLKDKYPNVKVYCQGTSSLINELRDADIVVTEKVESDVGLVLVGFDTELTSQKLRNTCELLQKDIPYYATNPDLACPVSFGFIPDCGSICQMIKNATGKEPIFIGKPKPTMVDIISKELGVSKDEIVIVGDRLYTDIAIGINAKTDTICVLTGEATVDEILNGNYKPTYTFFSVSEILI